MVYFQTNEAYNYVIIFIFLAFSRDKQNSRPFLSRICVSYKVSLSSSPSLIIRKFAVNMNLIDSTKAFEVCWHRSSSGQLQAMFTQKLITFVNRILDTHYYAPPSCLFCNSITPDHIHIVWYESSRFIQLIVQLQQWRRSIWEISNMTTFHKCYINVKSINCQWVIHLKFIKYKSCIMIYLLFIKKLYDR